MVWMSNYIPYKIVLVTTYPCHNLSQCMLVHYDDVIMTMLASQITSLMVVYSIVYSGVNQRKHQSSASLAFVREIHRGPVNFPHKWAVTRKMFPFDDVIMKMWQAISRTSGTSTHCIYMPRLILRLAPRKWETSLQSNAVSHWQDANLESALYVITDAYVHQVKHEYSMDSVPTQVARLDLYVLSVWM